MRMSNHCRLKAAAFAGSSGKLGGVHENTATALGQSIRGGCCAESQPSTRCVRVAGHFGPRQQCHDPKCTAWSDRQKAMEKCAIAPQGLAQALGGHIVTLRPLF